MHDVDEDLRTAFDHGGSWGFGWSGGDAPGVFLRNVLDAFTPTSLLDGVASRLIYLS